MCIMGNIANKTLITVHTQLIFPFVLYFPLAISVHYLRIIVGGRDAHSSDDYGSWSS